MKLDDEYACFMYLIKNVKFKILRTLSEHVEAILDVKTYRWLNGGQVWGNFTHEFLGQEKEESGYRFLFTKLRGVLFKLTVS